MMGSKQVAGFGDESCSRKSIVLQWTCPLLHLYQTENEVQFIPGVYSPRDKIHLSCQAAGLEMLLSRPWIAENELDFLACFHVIYCIYCTHLERFRILPMRTEAIPHWIQTETVQIGNEVPLWIFAPNKVAHSLGMAMTPPQLTWQFVTFKGIHWEFGEIGQLVIILHSRIGNGREERW